MKSFFLRLSIFSIVATFILSSCSSSDENPWVDPTFKATGAYVLNEGVWEGNNSKLTYYDIKGEEESETTEGNTEPEAKENPIVNIFERQNAGHKLGDTANDIIISGNRMYIATTTASIIFVTDLEAKMIEKINLEEKTGVIDPRPRYMAVYKDHLYVTCQSGHLMKMDLNTYSITTLEIEEYSEQLTVVEKTKELYIANSDHLNGTGAGNTVTIVDLNSFKIKGALLEIGINPYKIVSDYLGNVYVAYMGNYISIPAGIKVIDSNTKEVKDLKGASKASYMTMSGHRLLMAYQEGWNPSTAYFYSYDITTTETSQSFLTIPAAHKTELNNVYSISVDPNSKDIYVGTSSYGLEGNIFVFESNGVFKSTFRSGGYGPNKVVFVTEQTN